MVGALGSVWGMALHCSAVTPLGAGEPLHAPRDLPADLATRIGGRMDVHVPAARVQVGDLLGRQVGLARDGARDAGHERDHHARVRTLVKSTKNPQAPANTKVYLLKSPQPRRAPPKIQLIKWIGSLR